MHFYKQKRKKKKRETRLDFLRSFLIDINGAITTMEASKEKRNNETFIIFFFSFYT